MHLLKISDLKKSFGGVQALAGVSFGVEPGTIVGLIGPNGSGKTTLFNCVTGVLAADAGEIKFAGNVITDTTPHKFLALGMARTFQLSRLFTGQTVVENILTGMSKGSLKSNISLAREALQSLEIAFLANEYVEELSYGQQKLVELARLLVHKPKFYMLDEPFAGINPTLSSKIMSDIKKLRKAGATFLIVEHDMEILTRIADRLIVLDQGRLLAEGTPERVLSEDRVRDAYLGRKRG